MDSGATAGTNGPYWRDARFRIEEPLVGLSPDTKETVVSVPGAGLEKGQRYLVDAGKADDGRLFLKICGASGTVTSADTAEALEYLRMRALGKATTFVKVKVFRDRNVPMIGVDVSISGPSGTLSARTDTTGVAVFNGLEQGHYRASAASAHYHYTSTPRPVLTRDVDVLEGTCRSARIDLQSESSVSGVVWEAPGTPAAFLDLELVSPLHSFPDAYSTRTDKDGKFLFTSVSPGQYLLGSNIIGIRSSTIPPTYYPGVANRDEAARLEVSAPDSVLDGLVFTLPDLGGKRDIEICVVDEHGVPVSSATLITPFKIKGKSLARLGHQPVTDKDGCVREQAYAKASYEVEAMLRSPDGTRFSESFVVVQGKDSVHHVLTLGKLITNPKP